MASFQYLGTAFPWDGTLGSFIEVKNDHEILRTSILMILFTRLGERVMLRDFGSNIYDKPFEPNDITLATELTQEVREAIAKWDDRIGIKEFNITAVDHVLQARIIFFNAKDPAARRVEEQLFVEISAQDIKIA
jgi:phage baseplate assembly protein W